MNDDKQAQDAIKDAERLRYLGDRQKAAPKMKTWSPPELTEQEQREHDEYVKKWAIPF